jgi:hypothetical protein
MGDIKQHTQNYYLDVKFGSGKDTTDNPTGLIGQLNPIDELCIIQDINRFLPTFRLKFQDIGGIYSNLKSFDSEQNKIRISFNRNSSPEGATFFDFDVTRRFPTSDHVYDIEGVLHVNDFFKPSKIRGFNTGNNLTKTVKDIIELIGLFELDVEEVDISPSLNFSKNIIQPDWTNAELLSYLKENIIGINNEAGYFCFITCKQISDGIRKVLVFKSLKEFYSQQVKYTFADVSVPTPDQESGEMQYPIMDYSVYDNYKMLETSGYQNLDYSYFDYNTSEYKVQTINVKDNNDKKDDYYSLTQYFGIDKDSSTDNLRLSDTGRSNDFTLDFKGKTKNKFFKMINSLSKIWILSWGFEDIYPGDIVRLQFMQNPATMVKYQFHGYWMVERVVHILGVNFGTRLLLTRNGLNTDEESMLVLADDDNRK